MELILIRHGLPELTVRDDGAPADPDLSEKGHEQAQQMAKWLSSERIDALYSSPMKRAMQTAAPLAAKIKLAPQLRDGIAEYDRTADSYIPVEQLKELDYDRWKRMMDGDTETDFVGFVDEVVTSLNDIINENKGKRVAVVCHGGVINAWTTHVIGLEPKMFFNPTYTSINRFMVASSGEKSVHSLNEHAHLGSKRDH